MNTSLPSPSTVRGLCAAFFLAGAVSAVQAIANIASTWSRPEMIASIEITSLGLFAWTLFGLIMVLVGVRLLYDRPHCVWHGLIAAWLILACRVYAVAKFIWIAVSYKQMTLSPAWMSGAFSMAIMGLMAGVVIWLLHGLRLRQDREVSIPSAAQIA